MNESSTPTTFTDHQYSFVLERYKYLLQQLHALNEQIHKYFTLYQTISTAIIGSGAAIYALWIEKRISPEMASRSLHAASGLFIIITLFILCALIASIMSWIDYRNEETSLLDKIVHAGFRSPPSLKNCWRWGETYMCAIVLLAGIVVTLYSYLRVLPSIN